LNWEENTPEKGIPKPTLSCRKGSAGKRCWQGCQCLVTAAGFPGRPPAALSSGPVPGEAVAATPLS